MRDSKTSRIVGDKWGKGQACTGLLNVSPLKGKNAPGFPGASCFLFISARALADFSAGHDEVVGVLLRLAGLLAFAGRLAPHALGTARAAALAPLTAAVR